jgi:predicted nucleic-acid-binding protein
MSVGLDTSVVLRLLTGEPEGQARCALDELRRIRDEGGDLFVSDLVIAEAYFALHHHYGIPKPEALRLIALFLAESGVRTLGVAAEVLASRSLPAGKPGFVDRLIHAEYLRSAKEVLTFEKAGERLPGVRVLTPS